MHPTPADDRVVLSTGPFAVTPLEHRRSVYRWPAFRIVSLICAIVLGRICTELIELGVAIPVAVGGPLLLLAIAIGATLHASPSILHPRSITFFADGRFVVRSRATIVGDLRRLRSVRRDPDAYALSLGYAMWVLPLRVLPPDGRPRLEALLRSAERSSAPNDRTAVAATAATAPGPRYRAYGSPEGRPTFDPGTTLPYASVLRITGFGTAMAMAISSCVALFPGLLGRSITPEKLILLLGIANGVVLLFVLLVTSTAGRGRASSSAALRPDGLLLVSRMGELTLPYSSLHAVRHDHVGIRYRVRGRPLSIPRAAFASDEHCAAFATELARRASGPPH